MGSNSSRRHGSELEANITANIATDVTETGQCTPSSLISGSISPSTELSETNASPAPTGTKTSESTKTSQPEIEETVPSRHLLNPMDEDLPRKRKSNRKRIHDNGGEQEANAEPQSKATKRGKRAKRTSNKTSSRDLSLDFTWICTECNEAECLEVPEATLVLCEGKCHRPFHYPCANLSSEPSPEEKWICDDCQKERHLCSLCQEFGYDDVDVFCCDKEGCGLFFHESCLSMQNVEIQYVENGNTTGVTLDGEAETLSKPRFTCQAHTCWTCTDDYVPPEEDEEPDKRRIKGRKKNKTSNSFERKRDPKLFRCLYCPIAYHLSCIPPTSRFHELALLCHEHAGTRKLPYLDLESSVQSQVERAYAKKLEKEKESKIRAAKVGRKGNDGAINPFFPGVVGDSFVTLEDKVLAYLQKEEPDHEYLLDGIPFCLPCDIQDEVTAKPPSYRHVQSLQYNVSNRPKRKPPTDSICECKSNCDESCLNRMVMIECVGDPDKISNGDKWANCAIGPSCTNRVLGQKKFANCKPMREQGKGWGLVTVNGVKKGDLVQEYVGEVIDQKEKEIRLQQWSRDHPNDPNFYVMQLDTGWFIDARHEANLSRFINHSCGPNCRLVPFNVGGYMRVGIYSLYDIKPGEFLSYDYQFDTRHGDRFQCRCGAAKCRGTMKGGKGEGMDGAGQKTRKEEWEEAKVRYDRDRKYLEEAENKEMVRACQVEALVPAAENPTETVAAGPNKKYREIALSNRLFLWRNVMRGSDFSERPDRRKKQRAIHNPSKLDVFALLSQKSPG